MRGAEFSKIIRIMMSDLKSYKFDLGFCGVQLSAGIFRCQGGRNKDPEGGCQADSAATEPQGELYTVSLCPINLLYMRAFKT